MHRLFLISVPSFSKVAFLLLFACSIVPNISFGQRILSAAQQQEDLQVFEASIKEIHPGLYWYLDSTTVDERFNRIKENSQDDRELRSFYGDVLGFYANMGCGHSWMSMPYELLKYWENGPYQIPLNLYNTQDDWYVIYDLSDQSIPKGTQLLSINGFSMKAIIDSLSHYTPTDGFIQTRKRRTAKQNLNFYFQSFISSDSVFDLQIREPNQREIKEVMVKGIRKETAKERFEERYADAKTSNPYAEMFSTTFDSSGIATLKIKTFSTSWLKDNKVNYRRDIKRFFKQVKDQNINKVILDLRNNGGGDDGAGALLCTYLIPDKFKYFERMEAVTKKFRFKEHSNSKFLNLKAIVLKKDRDKPGYFEYTLHPPLKTQKPSKYVYEGQLVVLQNGGSFSTTADVTSILYENDRGYFIGEENGGGYYGNNSAMMYQIKLPHSNINYYIPVIRYYSAVDKPELMGRGVPVDQEAYTSYEQYLNKEDAGMEAAKTHFEKGTK